MFISDDFIDRGTWNDEHIHSLRNVGLIYFTNSLNSPNIPSIIHNHYSSAPGPEIMALMTPFPSSLFPVRVALNAATASSNLYLSRRQKRKLDVVSSGVAHL